jgi:hypothetical protein
MKITNIETHVLLVPNYNPEACSSAQDDIVAQPVGSARGRNHEQVGSRQAGPQRHNG